MEYILIENQIFDGANWHPDYDPDLYQIDTEEQQMDARQAMQEAGMTSAKVYASPFESIEALYQSDSGSVDDVETGSIFFI